MTDISTDTGKTISFVRKIRYPDKEKVRKLNNIAAHPRSRCWMVTIPAKYVNRDPTILTDVAKRPGWSYIGQMEEGTGKRFEENEGNRPKAPEGTVDPEGNPVQWLYGTDGLYQGLQHYHFCFYTPQMRMGSFAKLFPTQAHIDNVQRGKEAVARYCSKLDTRIAGPWQSEGFSFDGQGKRTDLTDRQAARQTAFDGTNPLTLIAQNVDLAPYAKELKDAYAAGQYERSNSYRDVQMLYLIGDGRVGKSLYAKAYAKRRKLPFYIVPNRGPDGTWHPWDMYDQQRTLIWNEFNRDKKPGMSQLLEFWEGEPQTQLTARYANGFAFFDRIVFTSNVGIRDCYDESDLKNRSASVLGRITTVRVTLDDDLDTVRFEKIDGPTWWDGLPETESIIGMMEEVGMTDEMIRHHIIERQEALDGRQETMEQDGEWENSLMEDLKDF
ncbi:MULTISPECIES: P-loop NTPase family protein [Bifidobacterium]|uniref:Replication protein n=2 Tax=Bifidobacterium TaxID=1678 RepID=A0A6L4WZW7_9BIFI|nr:MULTISPECIES: hypothetical protein [Bifidobacterium]KAB8287346.1 hypothetical protein DSM100688_1705 [Bifidobacterium ramosum]NEG55594.1 hypothetical protein [Bifidobacterium platyrrhinorum]NEG72386.1 hypothetical protein [Bifidobacterium ramosum]